MELSNIRKYRINNNITQKEIVEKLNVTKGTYSAWETGLYNIPLNRLNDLCNYLDVSIDFALDISKIKHYNDSKEEIDKSILSKRLREVRKEKGFTLKELANELNTSVSVLSRYETGKTTILVNYLYDYATILHVSADYLLGKVDYPKYMEWNYK